MTAKELADQATELAAKLKPGTWDAVLKDGPQHRQGPCVTAMAKALVTAASSRRLTMMPGWRHGAEDIRMPAISRD